jgi:acetyl-CoA synthetase
MSNPFHYEDKLKEFRWTLAEDELGYKEGGEINIGWYCSDRICMIGKADKIALTYEGFGSSEKKFTFNDIRLAGNTIGTFLRNLGLVNEDKICLYMDRIPELYFSFLGILKIGGIVQPMFASFGEESLLVRLADAQTRAIITQKKHLFKVRKVKDKLPYLEFIIVVDYSDSKDLQDREIAFSLEKTPVVERMNTFPAKAESPSVLHYTSGTTGQPKGVKHVHYSLISQYLTAKWVLDLKDSDIYWCTADPGWVTGTSYGIIGPWSLGITQCVLDSGFSAQNWYRFIEKHKVTVWYSSPTAIRSLLKAGNEIVNSYDLSSLRYLASVGEPLNPEAVRWSSQVFGKEFHDTYWQTETGSIMISNYPGMMVKPGSMGKPFPGVTCVLLDQKTFQPLSETGKIGLIAFKQGWPSMMRAYLNDELKYKEKFINGWYLTGDKARIDNDGYFWFIGRDDDVINTGGHLVSPFEVESSLLEHPAVGESAVVSKPDEVNMEVVKAFITLKPGFNASSDLELDIMNFIRKRLSPLAMPQEIEFIDKLPKTRSGKIMRRLLYKRERGEEVGDISSLEDE